MKSTLSVVKVDNYTFIGSYKPPNIVNYKARELMQLSDETIVADFCCATSCKTCHQVQLSSQQQTAATKVS